MCSDLLFVQSLSILAVLMCRADRSDRSTSAIWRHMMGRIPEVVSENVVNLAEVGMTQREADRELRAAAGQLAATLSRTFRYTPSMPGSSSGAPEASIEGLMDIEESVWAPRYGLKGYIDATVLVRHLSIHQNGNTSSSNAGGKLGLAALEFKSGKQHHSHHAQLGTYGLLLQSRYGVEAAGGLLWYSRVENMEFTSKGPRDVAGGLYNSCSIANTDATLPLGVETLSGTCAYIAAQLMLAL